MRGIGKSFIVCLFLLIGLLTRPMSVQAQEAARIGVFEPVTAAPGTRVEVPVRVEEVQELYAVDIEIRFDPAVLAAEDADPGSPGIQLGIAGFLEPGLVLYNEVDNQQGIARFVMTQVNPSEPKSGSGILLVLYLKGLKEGESALTVSSVQLSDRGGNEIPAAGVNGSLKVEAAAPAVKATPIPVANASEVQWIPGQTEAAEGTAEVQQYMPLLEAGEPGAEAGETSWLAQYWWVLLAAGVILAAGFGFYRYRSR